MKMLLKYLALLMLVLVNCKSIGKSGSKSGGVFLGGVLVGSVLSSGGHNTSRGGSGEFNWMIPCSKFSPPLYCLLNAFFGCMCILAVIFIIILKISECCVKKKNQKSYKSDK